ncbi:hypothetical protein EWF00_08780, partial [Campylobacter jejuni]|nr:hypothetical protein [Campylobacter jejuni]
NFYSAVKVVQNHLSYKIGKAIINAKTFKLKFLLPLTLLKIIKHHRLEYQIYSCLIELNPGLKRYSLESYSDYEEALKIKNYFSYKLGNLIIKHPFTFIFRLPQILRRYKQ